MSNGNQNVTGHDQPGAGDTQGVADRLANLMTRPDKPTEESEQEAVDLLRTLLERNETAKIERVERQAANVSPRQQIYFRELLYHAASHIELFSPLAGEPLRYDLFVIPFVFQTIDGKPPQPGPFPRLPLAPKIAESFGVFNYLGQKNDAVVLVPRLFVFNELIKMSAQEVGRRVQAIAQDWASGSAPSPGKLQTAFSGMPVLTAESEHIGELHLRFMIGMFRHAGGTKPLEERFDPESFMTWSKAVSGQLNRAYAVRGRAWWPQSFLAGLRQGWHQLNVWSFEKARDDILRRTGENPADVCAAISRHQMPDGRQEVHVSYFLPGDEPRFLDGLPWRLVPQLDDLDEAIDMLVSEHQARSHMDCIGLIPGQFPAESGPDTPFYPLDKLGTMEPIVPPPTIH